MRVWGLSGGGGGAIDGFLWVFTLRGCEGQRGEVIDHLRERDLPTPHNDYDS